MIGQPKETYITVNGSGGAFVDVPNTIHCRYCEIEEAPDQTSGAYAPQGLQYQKDDDSYALTRKGVVGEKLSKGDLSAQGGGAGGRMIGGPANSSGGGSRPASIPWKVKSLTVTATVIILREWA